MHGITAVPQRLEGGRDHHLPQWAGHQRPAEVNDNGNLP